MPPPPDAPMCPDPAPPPPAPEDDEETEDEGPAGAPPATVPAHPLPHLEIPANPSAGNEGVHVTPKQESGQHHQPGSGPGGVVSPSRLSLSMGPSIVHAASGSGAEAVAPAIAAAVAAQDPLGGLTSPGNGMQPAAVYSQALVPGKRLVPGGAWM
jgi:hypothetical protein